MDLPIGPWTWRQTFLILLIYTEYNFLKRDYNLGRLYRQVELQGNPRSQDGAQPEGIKSRKIWRLERDAEQMDTSSKAHTGMRRMDEERRGETEGDKSRISWSYWQMHDASHSVANRCNVSREEVKKTRRQGPWDSRGRRLKKLRQITLCITYPTLNPWQRSIALS